MNFPERATSMLLCLPVLLYGYGKFDHDVPKI